MLSFLLIHLPKMSSLYSAEDASYVASSNDDTWTSDAPSIVDSSTDYDILIDRLIDSELHQMPESNYLQRFRDRSIEVTTRQYAINWMLTVHAYYHFRPVTAYLSVNYLDRFLSLHALPNGWPFQLLSVACLSLAAKMEETSVPLLSDLQVAEPRFVFEPITVQRMELLVMANLKWRMHSVTPFDFLDYFVVKITCFGSRYAQFRRVYSHASDLILSTSRVIDFLGYLPSTIAAAAVLCAARESVELPVMDDPLMASFHERVSNEMVKNCYHRMEEYIVDTCRLANLKHWRTEPDSPTPVGVLDAAACGSCDCEKSGSQNPESSQAVSPNKRRRSAAPGL
ncbi:hypothetical protein HHK36_008274 [Tetracentron sinense]|uniref:Cyclin N-terminal domain-containing protein n=1 Tax=Tetracentron sinense TaxID=13715 RepID=A0A834ZJ79_TETSI|nr:hypothetical protein HHK36_008274 [Tetracentron sinense]